MIPDNVQHDIKERVNDALLLYDSKRYEGALLMALLSLAAIAEEEYAETTLLEYFEKKSQRYGSVSDLEDEKKEKYKRRFPSSLLFDNEKFKCLVLDNQPKFLSGVTKDAKLPGLDKNFEDILYSCMRCKLVHTGGMPSIRLANSVAPESEDFVIRLGDPMTFTPNFVLRVVNVANGYL